MEIIGRCFWHGEMLSVQLFIFSSAPVVAGTWKAIIFLPKDVCASIYLSSASSAAGTWKLIRFLPGSQITVFLSFIYVILLFPCCDNMDSVFNYFSRKLQAWKTFLRESARIKYSMAKLHLLKNIFLPAMFDIFKKFYISLIFMLYKSKLCIQFFSGQSVFCSICFSSK